MIVGIDASRAVTGRRTGTEAYAYHLIRGLASVAAARGHSLHLYYNQAPPDDLFPVSAGIEHVVIPRRRLWTHTRLKRELASRPPDVFFTPAHVIPWGYRGPAAATVHDLGYEYFPEAHPRRQLAYLRWSTQHNARVARQIFADSSATRDDLMRLYGTDAAKITVVYPGTDPDLSRIEDPAVVATTSERYRIRQPYMLYLGTLQPRKNLVRLVEAFALSGLPFESYSLVLAGKTGWLAQSVLEAVARQPEPIRDRVLLPGYIDETDKAALLTGATALVFPSLYEGFGFPVLEAQACGTPVVCSNSSSLPEVAGEGAILVDPLDVGALADAMRTLATDEALRSQLIAAGQANLARFSWDAAAEQVMSALEEITLCAGQPPSPVG